MSHSRLPKVADPDDGGNPSTVRWFAIKPQSGVTTGHAMVGHDLDPPAKQRGAPCWLAVHLKPAMVRKLRHVEVPPTIGWDHRVIRADGTVGLDVVAGDPRVSAASHGALGLQDMQRGE